MPRRGGRHKAPTHAMHFAKIFSGESHWLTLGDHCRIVFVTALYQKSSSPGNSDEHGPCCRSCNFVLANVIFFLSSPHSELKRQGSL